MNIGGFTAIGPREANEDSLYYLDFSGVDTLSDGICAFAMVSDGMGGYQGGDVASGLAVACAQSYVTQLLDMAGSNVVSLDASAALVEIVRNAHESILAESNARGNTSMGATFVGAFVSRTHAWIAHVGDSRAYLVRGGECIQLTEDHSQVGRMLSRGVITEQEAQNHPDRNRIERALGFSDAAPDVMEVDLVPGDALLLCSDGVYTTMDSPALGGCVDGARSAAAAAERAVKLALRRGSDDNATAVVLIDRDDPSRTQGFDTIPYTPTDTLAGTLANGELQPRSQAYRRRAQRKASPFARLAPFVVAALLLGIIAIAMVRACSADEQVVPTGGQAAPAATGAPEQQGQVDATPEDPDVQAEDTGSDASGFAGVVIPAGTSAQLKYVDQDGTAQLFSYAQLSLGTEVSLLPGSTVALSETSDSYNRIGRSYQLLSDEYLQDLWSDLSSYKEGGVVPASSRLAHVCDAAQYERFLADLAGKDSEQLKVITHLIIDALPSAGM